MDENGIVSAISGGTCTITASAESGVFVSQEVTCISIPDFNAIVKNECEGNTRYCTIATDGLSLEIDTNPLDVDDYSSYTAWGYVKKVNSALGLPNSVTSSMNQTNALQGKQSKTYGIIEVSWSYHPDNGLEVTYENTSGKAPRSTTA